MTLQAVIEEIEEARKEAKIEKRILRGRPGATEMDVAILKLSEALEWAKRARMMREGAA